MWFSSAGIQHRSFLRCIAAAIIPFLSLAYSQSTSYGALSVNQCSESPIQITSLSASCDTSGDYTYNNGGYRNSKTCNYSDKMKLTMSFDITSDVLSTDTDVLMTISAKANGVTLTQPVQGADLCSSVYESSSCPSAGSYTFTSQFYLPSSSDNDQSVATDFAPDIEVSFSTYQDSTSQDVGFATSESLDSDKCSSNNHWWDRWRPKNGTNQNSARSATAGDEFISDNMLLIVTSLFLACFALLLWRQSLAGAQTGFDDEDEKKVDFVRGPMV
mmetsp:Transcript_12371/g.22459  ORF Transcript_12371/g.22459 Transcript_12371/m.22459 type:complete len:273 (-) Transcript_12371:158-976(-)|eukprot:CAMPEP_0198292354 /NCGR_PEP_ID=MMETSP1449-20131203/11864_1 /TAXON_ID=420275 /ORGANISM="Attheya septentrionalis, Strain CCMP2084" /LENGTH=272 /DNA_ID=CAMNT_0043991355 /DNA_START=158 /DNA_END=976 /DNA_ORIENTATION=+